MTDKKTAAKSTALPSQEQNNTQTNASTNPPQNPPQWKPQRSKLAKGIFLLSIIVAILCALYAWHLPPFNHFSVYTNNAYVRGQTTLISSKVNGYVEKVWVTDFSQVKAGEPLVQIEKVNYQAKLEQAQANLYIQQVAFEQLKQSEQSAISTVTARQAGIDNAKAKYQQAQLEMKRSRALIKTDSVSQREFDQAQSTLKQTQAALAQAEAEKAIAEQDLINVQLRKRSAQANIENAQAAVTIAQQDLDNTLIVAPVDGKTGEIGVKQGQYVASGSQLMYLVPPQHWVIANLKEADTENVRLGQTVNVFVDALGGQQFHGKVSDIAPATQAEFSLTKADSSTGNFVKIAQRIAVKISLDPEQADLDRLAPGMSVEAEIKTR